MPSRLTVMAIPLVPAGALIATMLVGSSPAVPARQRSALCGYQLDSLNLVLERAANSELTPGTIIVPRPLPRHRVTIVYTGDSRPLRRWYFELLAAYSTEAKIGRIFDRYKNEVRVTEGGRDYWMPLADELRKTLRSSTSKGDTIAAFVDLAGAVVDPDRSDWLFVMRSFLPRDSVAPWLRQQCGDAPPN